MNLKLIAPTWQDEVSVWSYREAFLSRGDSLDGTAGLEVANSYAEWYEKLLDNRSEETVRPGMVPASTFLAVDGLTGRLVGMIDIRHRLNDYLLQFGGHIGYSVHPEERCHGYATRMLALALEECYRMDLDHVLVTCDRENIASARTIMKNGGIWENEVPKDGKIIQRHWITFDEG